VGEPGAVLTACGAHGLCAVVTLRAAAKSLKRHVAMTAISVAWYNFCRVQSSIGKPSAMASGLSDHAWTIKELMERAGEA
jgi:hypothetical protein